MKAERRKPSGQSAAIPSYQLQQKTRPLALAG
jgi:hypothetical protein